MAAVNGASGDQLPVPLSIISSRILTGLKSSPIATGIAIIHIVLTFSSFYFQKLAQALELNPSGILSQLSVWNFLTYILIEQDFFLLILNALFVLNAGSKLESVFSATLLQFTVSQ